MNLVTLFLIPLFIVMLIMAPLVPIARGKMRGKKARHTLIANIFSFFGVCLFAILLPIGGLVSAEATEAVAQTVSMGQGLGYLAAALSTGMSCIGAGLAVAAAAPAAIGACSEDEKSFGKSIVFVGLGEGIGIYGLLVSILIINSL